MASISKQTTSPPTQRERLTFTLLELKQDITSDDRKECIDKVGISEPSLKRYLTGYVGDSDTAAKLIAFFKQQIAKREAVIAA